MNNAYVALFAIICAAGLAAPHALAQQRDAYGNIIPADVVKHQREQVRRDQVEQAMRERRIIPGMTEADVRYTLGPPHRINDNGGFIQWAYDYTIGPDGQPRRGSTHVYFRDGLTR